MTEDDASRVINSKWLGGDPAETMCARAWRLRWRGGWLAVWMIDALACRYRGEPWGHCRRARQNHRAREAVDPDERLRAFDGA